ncbi:MAG: DUF4136 domain-containing protein, partial [Flavobacteriales bacterium]|nr:DUF4136 domain-containing protein [Flavobacteriales bacterium]
VFFIATLLTSCAAETGYEANPEGDFTKYKAFELCTEDLMPVSEDFPEYDNKESRQIIADAIKANLVEKGLEERSGEGSLFVNFDIAVAHKTQRVNTCTPTDEHQYWDHCEVKDMDYDEGTLSIRFTDLSTGTVLWEGWANGILVNRPASLKKAIDQAVQTILKPFMEDKKSSQ